MAAKHWVIGCGVGCGAVLLVALALFGAGAIWVRDMTRGFDEAVDLHDTLDERFGPVAAFTPWPDGTVPPARMEAFVAVREATAAARARVSESWTDLPLSESEARELDEQRGMEKARSILDVLGSAFSLAGGMGDLHRSRNQALLEAGMGLGEYTYIYVLAYQGWLGHSPDEGPLGRDDPERAERIHVQGAGPGVTTPAQVRQDVVGMFRRMLDALPPEGDDDWRRTLEAELRALEQDRRRVPWQDGLPDRIATSLEPYRDRLEANYDPVTNPFELSRTVKRGSFSYRLE